MCMSRAVCNVPCAVRTVYRVRRMSCAVCRVQCLRTLRVFFLVLGVGGHMLNMMDKEKKRMLTYSFLCPSYSTCDNHADDH